MADSKSIMHNMTQGSIPRLMLKFAIPFMAANLLQALYNIVDMAVVGRFVGSAGLSAASVGGQITNFPTLIAIAICSAGQILVGQLMGAGDKKRMANAITTLMWLSVIAGLLCTGLCLALYPSAIHWLNTPTEAVSGAGDYLKYCSFGLFFVFLYNGICGVLRGVGNSKMPLIFVAISAAVNLVLDLAFVAGFNMGVEGAAIATLISQVISCALSFFYLHAKRHSLGLESLFKSEPVQGTVKLLLHLASPLMLMQFCLQVSMLIISAHVNNYGLVAAAVYGVGCKLYSVVCIVSSAMSSASSTMVAQNMGAGKPERAGQSVWTALGIDCVMIVIIFIVTWFFPKQVFGIFNREPEVLDMAATYLHITLLLYISFNLMSPLIGLYNGVGAVQQSFIVSLLDSVVGRIGLSFLFAYTFNMGLNGFFLGSALASWISVIIPGIYFLSGKWKTRKLLE